MIRSAGVLMPVFSLPSKHGIGTLGQSAFDFIDFLAESGMTYWQMLPMGPTGFGNSPYQSLSSYAGNPYFIDLDELVKEGLLKEKEIEAEDWGKNPDKVDYGAIYKASQNVLKKACQRIPYQHPQDYFDFLDQEGDWVRDYAVFMAIKNERNGASWQTWPAELRNHDSVEVQEEAERLKDEVCFYERVQYLYWKQMKQVRAYAKERGIQIIGDLPFYAAEDSIDVWANPEQFDLDENYKMTYVSGFPDGQKWGNPLFDWDRQRQDGYDWWIRRAQHTLESCDVLRIDHFQGYQKFYAVPAEGKAEDGEWRQGPGLELFHKLEERVGQKQIIVEDLGQLTDEFRQMIRESGFPGMRILEYAFDPNDPGSLYMPFQYERNTVVYTGTHDNNTLIGWKNDPDQKARVERATEYLGLNKEEGFTWGMLRAAWASVSDLAIVQMQDLLEVGEEGRMNNPAGGKDPWTWRCREKDFDPELAKKIREKLQLYCRYNWNAKTVD